MVTSARICSAADPSTEYQVKAAFLLNFTKFVEWAPDTFAAANSPFAICILGENPFGETLDQIARDEQVQERKIEVLKISRPPNAKSCQVLFMSEPDANPAASLGDRLTGLLTVGESEQFLRHGGILRFVLQNRRVRFDVNLKAADRAGLKLSSKLLSVARNVEK